LKPFKNGVYEKRIALVAKEQTRAATGMKN
jgi:hypothetical protein